MPTILADSFTAALSRLAGDEQKQVKLTVFDLQTEPDRPGLQFHRIDNSKDPNFWSVRVSRDMRIIVHKTAGSLLIAYVGHHDDAYRWAERRRIETHPKTGALQIVEIRERVEEVTTRLPAQQAFEFGQPIEVPLAPATPAGTPLFAKLGRDDLLSVGVPEDWIADVRAADEDGFLGLADHLPAEAAEALLQYVSSGALNLAQRRLALGQALSRIRIRCVGSASWRASRNYEPRSIPRGRSGRCSCIRASAGSSIATFRPSPNGRFGRHRQDRRCPPSSHAPAAGSSRGKGASDDLFRAPGPQASKGKLKDIVGRASKPHRTCHGGLVR